jgi:4-amino-4-deoxy-L-arabinose transferase-like glycosyltransferase
VFIRVHLWLISVRAASAPVMLAAETILPTRVRLVATAALLVAAIVVCFLRVGAAPVYILNEAREGVYARAMLDSGNFLLPVVRNHVENGEHIQDKPPLVHWLSATATALRVWATGGHVAVGPALAARYDEWSLRFPSALAGVLTVAAIALLGRHLVGDRAALLAGATLLASWQFVHQARYGRVDMALCGSVTLVMLLAGRALLDGSGRALLQAAAATALATLAKGVLGVTLPVAAGGVYVAASSLFDRSLARWRGLPWRRALLVWALLALPWYVAAISTGGMAVVRSQFLKETVGEFTGTTDTMRVAYYLGPWLLDSAPWNLLALLGVRQAWRRRDRRAGFCAVWWVCFLAIFQLAAYKRRSYLLPALPAGALLAGYWMDRWLAARNVSVRAAIGAALPAWWPRAVAVIVAAAAVGGVAVRTPIVQRWLRTELHAVDGALALAGVAIAAVALQVLVGSVLARRPVAATAALWLVLVAVFLGPVATGDVVVAQRHSPAPLVQRLAAALPAGEPATVLGVGDAASLLLLFYFPDYARIDVVPQRQHIPATLPAGHYLLSDKVWSRLLANEDGGTQDGWQVLWSDTVRERGMTIPVVFAEHRPPG